MLNARRCTLVVLEACALLFVLSLMIASASSSIDLYQRLYGALDYRGFVPFQTLRVTTKSPELDAVEQKTTTFPFDRWHDHDQVLIAAKTPGTFLRFLLPETPPGTYRLSLFLTRSYDYGIIRVSANGQQLGRPIDLWSDAVMPSGPIEVGLIEVGSDPAELELTVIARNEASRPPHYQFGIDGLRLEQVR